MGHEICIHHCRWHCLPKLGTASIGCLFSHASYYCVIFAKHSLFVKYLTQTCMLLPLLHVMPVKHICWLVILNTNIFSTIHQVLMWTETTSVVVWVDTACVRPVIEGWLLCSGLNTNNYFAIWCLCVVIFQCYWLQNVCSKHLQLNGWPFRNCKMPV